MKTSILLAFFSTLSLTSAISFAQSRSDIMTTIKHVSEVKYQGDRNTCTIFSTAALLESYYMRKFGDDDIDFSEQWLQYLVSIVSETGGGNGSYVTRNFQQVKRYGLAAESTLPYSKELWTPDTHQREIEKFCPGLSQLRLKRCISSHIHPGFLKAGDKAIEEFEGGRNFVLARKSASKFKTEFLNSLTGRVVSKNKVKNLLNKNITVTLEIDIFYGAWSTPHTEDLEIPLPSDLYTRGIVTYPENRSIDKKISLANPARHAVQIVGYDDDVEVEYKVAMLDGTIETFKRKGVYYFKNSWGTKTFGNKFELKADGKKYRIKGFGMITQDYANELGKFFSIDERHY